MSIGDNDSDIDFSNIKNFFTTDRLKKLLLILMVLVPVILTLYIRLLPADLPATESMAKNAVENYYKSGISQQIASQYPNLPPAQQQKLVNDQYAQFVKDNKASINQQVVQTSDYFKTGFQYTENGNTYTFLGDLDSYFFLRQARNIELNGNICDEVIEGRCIDTHMIAPLEWGAGASMHPYGTYYLYKFLHFFNPKINLMHAAFLLPTVVAIIAVISAFFLARKLMNDIAGFFAAMLIAVNPLILSRSLGSDTDIWNIMFPILILWIFVEAFDSKNTIKTIILSSLTGLLFAAFAFAWGGWWYFFDFILIGIIGYIIYEILKNIINHKTISTKIFSELKKDAIVFGTILASLSIFVLIFFGFNSDGLNIITSPFTQPIKFSSELKVAATEDLWGNILTTVAELNEAGLSMIISQATLGMNIFLVLGMLGILALFINKTPNIKEYLLIIVTILITLYLSSSINTLSVMKFLIIAIIPIIAGIIMLLLDKDSKVDLKVAFILVLWLFGMIYTSAKGVRFILLLVPAMCISVGIALGYLHQYLTRIIHTGLNFKKIYATILIFVLLALLIVNPVKAGISTGETYMPSMTKGWWDTLTLIKEKSEPDAIINSWWDFGHWFKYVADRQVTFDGASQLPPLGHWMGKLLQTNNPKETHGILRMLNCGSNTAFEKVNEKFKDTEISENIVNNIILMDNIEANKYLISQGFTNSEVDEILKYSHCEPPEAYLITSGDMVGKAGVWSHFGLWNIDKAYIINNLRDKPLDEAVNIMKERWNYSDEEATKIYYDIQTLQTDRQMNDWISPWPGYGTGSLVGCSNLSDMIICNIRMGIGGNGQQNYVIERTAINMTNPQMSQALISVYDATTGMKVGESFGNWNSIIIASDKLKEYDITNSTIGMSILVNVVESEDGKKSYSAIVSDPLLIDSTFTKLYFLDGKYMEDYFEKFSDITDMTGTRIIVWKVKN